MAIAVSVVGASLTFAGSALAATPTLYVNGTTGSDQAGANTCRLSAHPCATIQHAVDIAQATAKISVAAGTYDEQVLVDGKTVTISGAGVGKTFIQPTTLAVSNTTDPNHSGVPQSDIVAFTDGAAGGLTGVTVDGSKALETSCNADYVGVYFDDSNGTLSKDAIDNVEHDQSSFGCQQGPNGGVYVANSTTQTAGQPVGPALYAVTMKSIAVNGYTKDGITCRDIGTSCSISATTVTGIGATGDTAQNGIELYGMTSASVTGTTVTHNSYTSPNFTTDGGDYASASGILAINVGTLTLTSNHVNHNDVNVFGQEDTNYAAGPAQGTWTIDKNTITSATNLTGQNGTVAVPLGYGVGDGIDLNNTGAVTVDGNTVTSNADWGIALFGATNATIGGSGTGLSNTVSGNTDDGIYLGEYGAGLPSTNNTIANNLVKGNKHDGILADGPDSSSQQQATGNTFQSNQLANNLRYDAEDRSTGTGTAGTANTWIGDTCSPVSDSAPLGLCS